MLLALPPPPDKSADRRDPFLLYLCLTSSNATIAH